MGVAWLQSDPSAPLLSFNATLILSQPSSSLAELVAVLSALYVAPTYAAVNIFTDSQNVISSFDKMDYFYTFSPTFNPIFKISFYPIWFFVVKLIREKFISIELHKVKAHSNDHYNNVVDALAKTDGPTLTPNNKLLGHYYNIYFNKDIVLIPPRLFVKDLFRLLDFHNIQLLPHFKKYSTMDVDWIRTSFILNDNENNSYTSFKASSIRKFKVKLMFELLPTLEILKLRHPNLYDQSWTCPRCSCSYETFNHVLTCAKS